jgi:hypothetical protein
MTAFNAVQTAGLALKLWNRSRTHVVEIGRYLAWGVVYPIIFHLVGDITTNLVDMAV